MKEKVAQSRGFLMGMGGFFAGSLAGQLVSWSVWPKAGLVVGVGVLFSLLLLALLPKPSS